MKDKNMQRYKFQIPGIYRSEHDTFLPGNIARGVIEIISRKAIPPLTIQTTPSIPPSFHFSGNNDQYRNQNYLTHHTLTPPPAYWTVFHPSGDVAVKQKNSGFTRKPYRLPDRHTPNPEHNLSFSTSQRPATLTKNYSILSNPSL